MKNLVIARRYAKALLLIGKGDGKAEVYKEELSYFTALLNTNKALKQVVLNPLYSERSRKKVLLTIIDKLKLSRSMVSFLVLLFNKERISFLSHINDSYAKFVDEMKGIARAKLISATQISSELVEEVRVALAKRIGKDVILEVKQDSKLIGGVVATIGDLVLDGSVKTQLDNMRESFKRGESV